MGNMKCATDIKQTFTQSGIANDSSFAPGQAVKETTEYDGVTKTYVNAGSTQFFAGVAAGLPTGGGTIPTYAAGNAVQIYKNGGQAVVLLTGNVTDLTVALKYDGTGFTPGSAGDQCSAMPLELGSSGEYITVLLSCGMIIHA